ncbi:MAG: hypothetical protein IKO96_05680, partial [Spirochaetales bacterium]|nr:hypothetical protein [Spirochaetales bacterium]
VETPASVMLMDFLGVGLHKSCRQVTVMVGKTQAAMAKGSTLKVEGHHHTIENVTPQLYEKDKVRIDPALSAAYEFFTKGLEI